MVTIQLHNVQFYAFHGAYPGEEKVGNRFVVNMSVSFDETVPVIRQLDQTINYVRLHELVKNKMERPYRLLEELAMEVGEEIHRDFTYVKKIKIEILKLHPPIANFIGTVAVLFEKEY